MQPLIRLNKYLADSGVASRREADELIKSGRVLINGTPAILGAKVTVNDSVTVTGVTKSKTYLAYYKGRGIITHSPSEDEVDIKTRLKQDFGLTGLSPIGRLDKDSEGLLIVSNDGRITKPLLDPEHKLEKEYEVTVDKPVTAMFLRAMAAGVVIEGYRTKPATTIANHGTEKKFTLILTEGKKHQIRRMCAALGYQVQSLRRIRVGPISLGNLKPNQYRKIIGKELKDFLKVLNVAS
jgi:23S rRNA pseudouridine2604 synthase